MEIKLFVYPIAAFLVSIFLKWLVALAEGRVPKDLLVKYGGIPSSHSATVTALTLAVGIQTGIYSVQFAICAMLAILVIRDAYGLRMIIERQSRVINSLIKAGHRHLEPLSEEVGHTPLEVIAGVCVGIATVAILYTISSLY